MSEPVSMEDVNNPADVLRVAEHGVNAALAALDDLLTPAGWDLAYGQALVDGRLALARRITMAKALALYAGRDRRRR